MARQAMKRLAHPSDTESAPQARQLNLRISGKIYDMIHDLSVREGRSLNSAAAELIRRGHDSERDLVAVFGSRQTFMIARVLMGAAEAAAAQDGADQGRWTNDPAAWDRALQAVQQVTAVLRPGVRETFAEAAIALHSQEGRR
jgi:hypothetical protein